jgi:hypothetical protein
MDTVFVETNSLIRVNLPGFTKKVRNKGGVETFLN